MTAFFLYCPPPLVGILYEVLRIATAGFEIGLSL